MIKYNFNNKTILITAGSKGIGFCLAQEFSRFGAKVTICSRNKKNLEEAKKKIRKITNKNILTIKYDLNNTKDIKKLFDKTKKYYNSNVDILINNSGGPPPKEIINLSNKDWENAYNINLKSSINSSIIAVKKMKKKTGVG